MPISLIQRLADSPLDEKDMRQIFASIEAGENSHAEILDRRSAAHLLRAFEARLRELNAMLASEANKAWQASPKLVGVGAAIGFQDFVASLPVPETIESLGGAGRLAPGMAGKDLFSIFIQRRNRSSWATEARSAAQSLVFKDPLILSMLRRVPEAEVHEALNRLLLRAAINQDEALAADALNLGANPLAQAPLLFGEPAQAQRQTNLLGAILSRPQDNFGPRRSGELLILGSALLATATVDLESLGLLLSLRSNEARGSQHSGLDAFGTCMAFKLPRCAHLFAELTPDISKSLSSLENSGWTPHSLEALPANIRPTAEAALALAESKAIGKAAPAQPSQAAAPYIKMRI